MGDLQQISGPQSGLDEEEKPDHKKELREKVNLILPDGLMIVLAIIMIPVVLIPFFVDLPDAINVSFKFADYGILAVFIAEYLLKTVLAPNILKHILNPWHLLDLLVIIVPLINLLPVMSNGLGSSSVFLRLLRIIRIVAVSGRTVERRIQLAASASKAEVEEQKPMEIQIMDATLENIYEDIPFNKLGDFINSSTQTWINFSYVSEADYDQLSHTLDIPKIILESELVDDSYPRVDYFEHYSIIFARMADVKISSQRTVPLSVNRTGLLVICQGQNIITMSKKRTDIFNQILEKAKKIHSPQEPLAVIILYTIMKYIIEKDKQIIAALEKELIIFENTPLKERSSDFLETTFHLRKEVNQLVPALLHLKEIISVITSKRVPLEGFSERHEKLFDILMDEASYLHETASNARESLISLVDLHINTTAYQTNNVMRVIAVITSLSIITGLLGLLGSNIAGNPWDIQLWQVFGILGTLMLAMGWVFYRLGWLKG